MAEAAAALKSQQLVDHALEGIEAKLEPLLKIPLKEATDKLSPIENARLHVSLGELDWKMLICNVNANILLGSGYTLNALYFSTLFVLLVCAECA